MVKALVLVTLLSWLSTSVTIADVSLESLIIPSSHALEILKAAPISTSIKRHLRSNAAITSIEELLNLAPTLKQILPPAKLDELEFLQRQQSSPSDLFTHLKLDQTDIHQLLRSQDFFGWVAIVMSRYPKPYEEASRVMFETLSSHFKDDGALFKVLFEQQKIDDGSAASKFAEKLLKEQIKSWGEKHEKTSEEVFTLLNLHEAKGELFESSAVSLWVDFIKLSYPVPGVLALNKSPQQVMFRTLSIHYKGGDALIKALLERLKIDDDSFGRNFAEYLLRAQIESWGENDGKTSVEIFKLLNLHEAKGDLFESPAFSLWVDFVESSHKESPLEAYKFLYTVLLDYYMNDNALVKALVKRLDIDDESLASAVARSLLSVQIEIWRGDGKTAEEVFMLLNLGKVEDKLFQSPALSVWVAFVKLSSSNGKEAASAMFETLSRRYEGDALMQVLVAGENSKATRQVAEDLMYIWISKGRQAGQTKAQLQTLLKRGIPGYESRRGPA